MRSIFDPLKNEIVEVIQMPDKDEEDIATRTTARWSDGSVIALLPWTPYPHYIKKTFTKTPIQKTNSIWGLNSYSS
jgi:hypothetical protein